MRVSGEVLVLVLERDALQPEGWEAGDMVDMFGIHEETRWNFGGDRRKYRVAGV